MQDYPWDHSTFSKNRDRLIAHDTCAVLFEEVLAQARAKGLLSAEHFSVDGTLVRAWASQKSFVPKDGPPPPASGSKSNPEVNFRGQQRTNDTHESWTDPDSRLYRKSKNAEALPYYMGHALMETRNGLGGRPTTDPRDRQGRTRDRHRDALGATRRNAQDGRCRQSL